VGLGISGWRWLGLGICKVGGVQLLPLDSCSAVRTISFIEAKVSVNSENRTLKREQHFLLLSLLKTVLVLNIFVKKKDEKNSEFFKK